MPKTVLKKTKCLICAEEHKKDECPHKENVNQNIYKCANCGNNHLANDKTCQKYLNRLARRTGSPPTTQPRSADYTLQARDFPRINPTVSDVEPQTSSTWPNHNPANTNNDNTSFSELIPMIKTLFNFINISKIMQSIKSALIKLKNAPDNGTKLCVILEIVMELFG